MSQIPLWQRRQQRQAKSSTPDLVKTQLALPCSATLHGSAEPSGPSPALPSPVPGTQGSVPGPTGFRGACHPLVGLML